MSERLTPDASLSTEATGVNTIVSRRDVLKSGLLGLGALAVLACDQDPVFRALAKVISPNVKPTEGPTPTAMPSPVDTPKPVIIQPTPEIPITPVPERIRVSKVLHEVNLGFRQ